MISRITLLLFLALLLVYSSRAVSGNWIPLRSPTPGAALVNYTGTGKNTISFTLQLPGFYLKESEIEGKLFVTPVLDNSFPMLLKGEPDLPQVTTALQLPVTGTSEANVVSSKFIEFSGLAISPSVGNQSRNDPGKGILSGTSYQNDAFFPGELIRSDDPYVNRNLRGQAFHLFPFQYNPVTMVLRVYYEMEIEVTINNETGSNPLTPADRLIRPFPYISHSFLNTYDYPALRSGTLPEKNGRMLIICPTQFIDAIQPLMNWKNQSGIVTEVVLSEQFTDALQIREFVKEYYYSTGNLAYLLLVGDAEQVPTYMFPYGASDNFYSYIAGDDHYPDILVGRFSAATIKDVEIQVKRTLQYERAPDSSSGWLGHATGIASIMGPGDDGETDYEHVRNMLNSLSSFTYIGKSEFFDGSQGGLDADGDPSTQSILDQFNLGTGIILYTGHGATSTWGTGRITRSAISMINNPGKYPFIWSTACETGNFAGYSCLAETWMRASSEDGEPLGAVGALMASGTQTTHPPMEGQDEMVKQLSMAGQNNSNPSFGGISVSGMLTMNDIYGEAGYTITDTWILFGDPSFMVRTAPPAVLSVTHQNNIGLGSNKFDINVASASGVACLSANGKALGTALIENGKASITLQQSAEGETMLLTVTSFNYLPYISEINVIKEPAKPDNCRPVNHSERVSIDSPFRWSCGTGGIPDQYVFYLGTDNPPGNLLNGIVLREMSYQPAFELDYETTYFWRVDAINQYGASTGKVHTFSTIYGPDEDFEEENHTDIKWVMGGNSEWTIDQTTSFHGFNTGRSGHIEHNEYSSLIFPCEVNSCDLVGFWYKVSSEENKDKLQFLIDGNVLGEWSGNLDWTYQSYEVEPGNHQLEWRYIKDQNISEGEDAVWLDDISLPIHPALLFNSGADGMICKGDSFKPASQVVNYNSIQWITDGDGIFDDQNLVQPEYIPGPVDITRGRVQLTMNANGFEGCPTVTSEVQMTILGLPVITLPSDTIASRGNPLLLDAFSENASEYLWLPGNETSSAIIVDSIGSERGSKSLTLQVTNSNGCSTQKIIRVYFTPDSDSPVFNVYPNPCTRSFTLEAENGAIVLTGIYLINSMGSKVWEQKGNIGIINRQFFVLPSLPVATYFLVTENEAGRSIKPLVVQE